MNKNAIKKFATEARRELISRVGQRALKYGISDKEAGNPNDDSVGGHLLSSTEKKQRAALIEQIKEKGYEQVMEEVAYTWFNRFSALRFMEVNNYLPSHVRVFTDEDNNFKPQILTEAIHLDLDGLDMEKVYAYKEANDNDELYKYLLITQCNALSSVLPGMFQKIVDYTELLFPDNLLREGSVVEQMIAQIPEEDWKDAVQIIGWLYQYYNSEKKDDVFAALKKNVKITKENIPAATQLFTPDWIVHYMVENSLGRLWVEGHPNDELKSQWKYYLEEAEQEPDVQAQLASIHEEYKALKPEDILCIDPCCGSGHILAYMFDVLVQIYEAYGFTTSEAVASIVENNLYGLDIDDRAAQLAYFAVMMKARQYDRRFFSRDIQPHVYAIAESNHADGFTLDYFCNGDAKLTAAMKTIIEEMHDAKEYGSILNFTSQDWSALYTRFDEIREDINISRESALRELLPLVQVAEAMAQKYDVVVTNPPYMGSSNMSEKLSVYLKDCYSDSKGDFSAVFVERCQSMTKNGYFTSFVVPQSLLFLIAFKQMRYKMAYSSGLSSLIHLGTGAFDSGFGTVALVLRIGNYRNERGAFHDLRTGNDSDEKIQILFKGKTRYYNSQQNLSKLPNAVMAYWCSDNMIRAFTDYPQVRDKFSLECGIKNGNNDKFLRAWFEVADFKVNDSDNREICLRNMESGKTWFRCNKGGGYKKWYGNYEYVVDLENNAQHIKAMVSPSTYRLRKIENYFHPTITWPLSGGNKFGCRYMDIDTLPDVNANIIVIHGRKEYCLMGYMNSIVFDRILDMLNPTVNFPIDTVASAPYLEADTERIECLVKENISLAKSDWDSFEASWNFKKHPLIGNYSSITKAYNSWERQCDERFNQLKANEEELNRIFIDIYGLQDELVPEVEDKDVTVRIADLQRDIKSFISYAVGCMFGRYSLDVNGLAYAGGEWDASKYTTFEADKDNIIPICDDEYFQDDIVGRFVKFVEVVYGKETLDENLKFIADALGDKGQPKEVIRNYVINDFYADHCSMYSVTGSGKRPIYWLFDSGKKNGFKCLIYMHRYQPDTIARIRTDYVHEQQARYRTAIADLETRIANASTSERVKLNKQLKTLNDQATEIHAYEEKIHHLADQMISIDLDDGVKKNYEIFKDVLAKIK
jgi:hypothetical protein